MQLFLRAGVALLVAIPLGYGMWRTERLTKADWLARAETIEALQAASQLEPLNAAYYARLAFLDPERTGALHTALRLNPRNPAWWITLASRQEQAGDLTGAEQSLLKADSICQYYTPRWTTAYFYFRLGKREPFTKWARASLSVGAGETEPIFQMARRLGLSSAEIAREVVPDDPDKVAAFIDYLLGSHQPGETYEPAAKLVRLGVKNRRELVLRVCESLFENGNPSQAMALWNQTVKAGWVPFAELDPLAGKLLARTSFAGERIEHGFDWRYSLPQGISASTGEADGSLRLEFSGNEPPDCDLVSALTPLLPGKKYRLAVQYRLQGIVTDSGLAWSLVTIPDGKPLATAPLGKGAEASVTFDAPAKPARLQLAYHRNLGTTRIEGTAWIEAVNLVPVP